MFILISLIAIDQFFSYKLGFLALLIETQSTCSAKLITYHGMNNILCYQRAWAPSMGPVHVSSWLSKIQWRPFWLATHLCPQKGWVAFRVNYGKFTQVPVMPEAYDPLSGLYCFVQDELTSLQPYTRVCLSVSSVQLTRTMFIPLAVWLQPIIQLLTVCCGNQIPGNGKPLAHCYENERVMKAILGLMMACVNEEMTQTLFFEEGKDRTSSL